MGRAINREDDPFASGDHASVEYECRSSDGLATILLPPPPSLTT